MNLYGTFQNTRGHKVIYLFCQVVSLHIKCIPMVPTHAVNGSAIDGAKTGAEGHSNILFAPLLITKRLHLCVCVLLSTLVCSLYLDGSMVLLTETPTNMPTHTNTDLIQLPLLGFTTTSGVPSFGQGCLHPVEW